jgi:TetR/AcrR family transcriptional regulator, mexJK operon transcriptional repressor
MAETRAAILRAARPIMLRDGLDGTTLDQVAAEGGIAKMTLYRHFPGKESLFEGLVTSMCEYMREGFDNGRWPTWVNPARTGPRASCAPSRRR